jgi:hypothetical protein
MKRDQIEVQAADIFLKAADYIRNYGWQKEGMSENGKPRCSMGALASAYPIRKWDDPLSSLMYKALYDELDGMSLTQFNYRYRNGEKVAQLYEKVAKKLSLNRAQRGRAA